MASMSGQTKKKKNDPTRRGGGTEPAPRRHATLDDQLEQGLEESFPGSDPVAVTEPPHSPHDVRKP
jgi:hypothetical protein